MWNTQRSRRGNYRRFNRRPSAYRNSSQDESRIHSEEQGNQYVPTLQTIMEFEGKIVLIVKSEIRRFAG